MMKRASQRLSKYNKDPLYKCKSCSFIANRNDTYLIHLRRHHDSDLFYCKSCKYACTQRSEIRRHDKTHRELGAPEVPRRKPALTSLSAPGPWVPCGIMTLENGSDGMPKCTKFEDLSTCNAQTFQTLHDITIEASSLIDQAKRLNLDDDLYKRIHNIAQRMNKCTCAQCRR
jgi:hypothetical protein